MKIIPQALKYLLTSILILTSFHSFAQCEGLTGNKEGMKNWRSGYFNYFGLDSTITPVIKADSVLIYYFSNSENETNYGMHCCFYLAREYAQLELNRDLKRLYKQLEKADSLSFSKAQKAWQLYYKAESGFIQTAFVAHVNFSKYGKGREAMMDNASGIYQMIKERILTVRYYIEMTTTE